MAGDGSVKIKTEIDESGLDKGLKSIERKLKSTKNSTLATAANIKKLAAGTAIVGTIKAVSAVVNDLTDAYKVQARAEKQLESAAKNNPYLNNASVVALKNYASEIQSYSTYGDEELIPMMAKLAAGGRTQTEIMEIMTVATDMAASGAFSLDSAVSNLNKSFGGLSGELGESIPEIKALTTEQLKNGEAVKLLGSRYKGIAVDVAKATGTSEQLSNAIGDLKEELGAPFEKAMGPLRLYFAELISGYTNAKKAKREFEEAKKAQKEEKATVSQDEILLKKRQEDFVKTEKELNELYNKWKALKEKIENGRMDRSSSASAQKTLDEYTKRLQELALRHQEEKKATEDATKALGAKKDAEQALLDAQKQQADAQAKIDAQNKKNEDTTSHIKAVTEAREKAIEVLRLQADAEGKQVDDQDELNAYIASYVKLITESNGLITASDPIAQELLDTIQKRSQAIQEEIDAEEKLNAQIKANEEEKERIAEQAEENRQKLEDSVKSILDEAMSEKEVIAQEMELIELQYAQLTTDEQLKIQEDYNRAYELLKEKEVQINKDAEEQKRTQSIQSAQKILSTANDFATQYMNIQKTITDMATQAVEAETAIKSLELEKQYASGAVSLEEYEKKKLEIEYEAAQKKYKLDMWEWSSSVLSATSSTALAVVKALEAGPIIGPIMAGLIGAAGAAQLVPIMASKPQPPQPPAFATGGIVGGNSYTGDKVLARLDSGEMILNPRQQRNLFDSIDSGNINGANMNGANVQIYNSAANDVKVKPEITEKGIKIMIDKTVASTMGKGGYNDSMKAAQGSMRGKRITQ